MKKQRIEILMCFEIDKEDEGEAMFLLKELLSPVIARPEFKGWRTCSMNDVERG